jgi:hypothetical protein
VFHPNGGGATLPLLCHNPDIINVNSVNVKLKLFLYLIKRRVMKTCGGSRDMPPNSPNLCSFTLEKNHGTHFMDPGAGMNDVERE